MRVSVGLALAAMGTVAAQAVAGGRWPALLAVIIAIGSLPLAPSARAIALWAVSITVSASLGLLWQVSMGIATVLLAVIAALSPTLRPEGLSSPGDVPLWPTLVVGGVTPVALASWLILLEPDLSDVVAVVPPLSLPLLVVLGVAFTVINAALEELLWRGFLQPHLAALTGPAAAVLLQAISFGVQHAHGVPRGLVGMGLAGSWAILLGALRTRAKGLLAPLLAHIVADATIAVIVLGLAHSR